MAVMNPIELPIEISLPKTGMATALLTEIMDRLQTLADHGAEHVIDLTSLPMNNSDKRELETLLGQGEVNITLSTIGDSKIMETAYSGIWWIKHYTPDQILVSELIEITRVPEIIKSHPDDINQAARNFYKIFNLGQQENSYE